jgi:hypothetical protein
MHTHIDTLREWSQYPHDSNLVLPESDMARTILNLCMLGTILCITEEDDEEDVCMWELLLMLSKALWWDQVDPP